MRNIYRNAFRVNWLAKKEIHKKIILRKYDSEYTNIVLHWNFGRMWQSIIFYFMRKIKNSLGIYLVIIFIILLHDCIIRGRELFIHSKWAQRNVYISTILINLKLIMFIARVATANHLSHKSAGKYRLKEKATYVNNKRDYSHFNNFRFSVCSVYELCCVIKVFYVLEKC